MKKLFSFIAEALILESVIAVLLWSLLFTNFLTIRLQISFFSLSVAVVSAIIMIINCPIVLIGIKATTDFLFKQSLIREGEITDIVPYERSAFVEKWEMTEKGRNRIKPKSYYVLFSVNGVSFKLIATSCMLEKGRKVRVEFGRFSRVIMKVEKVEQ